MEQKENGSGVDETREVQGHKKGEESKLEKCDENKFKSGEHSGNEGKKNASCQTDLQEKCTIYPDTKKEFELEKAKIRNNFIRERTMGEMNLREEYDDIVKTKNTLIQVLTEEKDYLWSELKNLRKSYDMLARRMESSQHLHGHLHHTHDDNFASENESDTSESWDSYHGNSCQVSGDVAVALRVQKEDLLKIFKEERLQGFQRCEREKIMLTEIVEKECDTKYARERTYLLESIDGLKEGLTSLTEQKDDLARIFEGEKNAMELRFARKEKNLKEQLKLEVQKKLIQAHASWSKTQI